jgi:hypothetical protein
MEQGNYCPLIKKKCIKHKCAWYTQVRGLNPNTGQEIDQWGCAVSWMPIMSIEVAQKQYQTGAAVESFRNEVVKANAENQQLYLDSIEKMEKGIIPASIMPVNPVINLLNSSSNDLDEKTESSEDSD